MVDVVGVNNLGLGQQRPQFRLLLPLTFEHRLVTDGLILTGVGRILGANK